MKPTQITELFANIRKTFVSFFSILMFVALGVGIFLGISWTAPAMQSAADKFFDEGSFHHFQILFPYGLTDDDLAKLAEIDGVTQVEPARQSTQMAVIDGVQRTVKMQTVGQDIDTLTVTEGALPTKSNEIALSDVTAKKLGMTIGSSITFEADADANSDIDTSMDMDADSSKGGESAQADSSTGDGDEKSGESAQVDSAQSADAEKSNESAQADSSKGGDAKDSKTNKQTEDNGMKFLTEQTFTVTALVNSPDYIAKESLTYGYSNTPSGEIDMLAWVTADAWKASAFRDAYPLVNVACSELNELPTYGAEYDAKSDAIEPRITELGDELGTARYDDLHDQAQKKIDDAEKKINDGKEQIENGEKELEEARTTLEQKRAEGEAKLAEGYQQLMYFEGEKDKAAKKLNKARSKVAEAESLLAEADSARDAVKGIISDARAYRSEQAAKLKKGKITRDEYNAAIDKYCDKAVSKLLPYSQRAHVSIPDVNHNNFDEIIDVGSTIVDKYEDIPVVYDGQEITIGQARKKLDEAKDKLADGQSLYNKKVAQLDQGWATYYAGQEELETLVADGEKKIEDGEKQLADAKKQVAENEPKLEQAKQQLAGMKKFDWTVSPRSRNLGASQISVFSNVTNNLSFSMAGLFVIVGLLVSYSAVSRIVNEQITQIGTKKALGLRAREITLSYLAYSSLAVISGAIIGTIVGVFVVEGIIGHAIGGLFVFGDYAPHFGAPLFLIVTLLELALVLGATWLACRGILKKHAVQLLRGPEPPKAKARFFEKWAIWNKLPLFTQTMINNCLNDKRRVFSTVVGVAGCTALIVTAITLNNDVLKSYDRHFSEVYSFNAISFVNSDPTDSADKVEAALVKQGCKTTQVVRKSYAAETPDGGITATQVVSPLNEEAFFERYHIKPTTGGDVDLSQDGAWVSQAFAEHFGAKPGDEITVNAGDGITHKIKILGFYEFWLTYNEMVMGHDFFEKEFGKTTPNAIYADTGSASVETVRDAISSVDGFFSMKNEKEYQYSNFATFSSVSGAVVAIYVALSTLMAIVVLLNLNVMFIEEKRRELIVLMINGFEVKDAKRYIYTDTIALTVTGIILGLVVGCIMGSITVGTIEPSTATFVKDVDTMAVVVGIVGSALLAFIMSVIALRRIPRFNLTDINKL